MHTATAYDATYWPVTYRGKDWTPEHGTYARYQRGCDCPACLDASAAHRARQRGVTVRRLDVMCECGKLVRTDPDDVRHGRFAGCATCAKKASR